MRFIKNQRINKIFWFALLTSKQRLFSEKVADSVLPADTDSEPESTNDPDFSYV